MGSNLDPVHGIREEGGEGEGGGVTSHSDIDGCGVSSAIGPIAYCIVRNDTIGERGEGRLGEGEGEGEGGRGGEGRERRGEEREDVEV